MTFQLFASLARLGGGWFANQSPEPTPIGHRSSAVAVSVTNTARLSLFRWPCYASYQKHYEDTPHTFRIIDLRLFERLWARR